MPALVAGIHVDESGGRFQKNSHAFRFGPAWMAGTSPAMTTV